MALLSRLYWTAKSQQGVARYLCLVQLMFDNVDPKHDGTFNINRVFSSHKYTRVHTCKIRSTVLLMLQLSM